MSAVAYEERPIIGLMQRAARAQRGLENLSTPANLKKLSRNANIKTLTNIDEWVKDLHFAMRGKAPPTERGWGGSAFERYPTLPETTLTGQRAPYPLRSTARPMLPVMTRVKIEGLIEHIEKMKFSELKVPFKDPAGAASLEVLKERGWVIGREAYLGGQAGGSVEALAGFREGPTARGEFESLKKKLVRDLKEIAEPEAGFGPKTKGAPAAQIFNPAQIQKERMARVNFPEIQAEPVAAKPKEPIPSLRKVVSGGQMGADVAGLRAAKELGIPTGGFAPAGWQTSKGPQPGLATEFGLLEGPQSGSIAANYHARTIKNLQGAAKVGGGSVIFSYGPSRGTDLTIREAVKVGPTIVFSKRSADPKHLKWLSDLKKSFPNLVVINEEALSAQAAQGRLRSWISSNNITVLNVAGHRPGSLLNEEKVSGFLKGALSEHQASKAVAPLGWGQTPTKGAPHFETSTAGTPLGKQFSAMNARLADGRTIEEAYQLDVKGYRKQGGTSWKAGKGKPPLREMSRSQLYEEYKALWRQWYKENPKLVTQLSAATGGKMITDKFAKTQVSQARVHSELLKEMHQAPAAAPAGPQLFPKKITTEVLRKDPKTLFVFGDNERRTGMGGQAQIRGQKNAIGIRTKASPSMKPGSFWTGAPRELAMIDEDIANVLRTFKEGNFKRIHVIPGIGMGLSKLQETAPETLKYLQDKVSQEITNRYSPKAVAGQERPRIFDLSRRPQVKAGGGPTRMGPIRGGDTPTAMQRKLRGLLPQLSKFGKATKGLRGPSALMIPLLLMGGLFGNMSTKEDY